MLKKKKSVLETKYYNLPVQSAPLVSSNQVYFGAFLSFCKLEEVLTLSKSPLYTVVKARERKSTALFPPWKPW